MTGTEKKHARNRIGAELLGWMPFFGIALIFVNDQIRVVYPSWLTGKLSDVAVLLYLPFLLSTGLAVGLWAVDRVRLRIVPDATPFEYQLTRRRLIVCLFLSGAGLSAVNLSYTLRDLYLTLLRTVDVFHLFGDFVYTVDPTDLVALAALYPAWRFGNRFVVSDAPVRTPREEGG